MVDVKGVKRTHNASERALRPAVIWHKLSFYTQGAAGSRLVETILSVIETCHRQCRLGFGLLTAALQAHFVGQRASLCWPGCERLRCVPPRAGLPRASRMACVDGYAFAAFEPSLPVEGCSLEATPVDARSPASPTTSGRGWLRTYSIAAFTAGSFGKNRVEPDSVQQLPDFGLPNRLFNARAP